MKRNIFLFTVTVFFIIVIAAGCTKNNPAGPGPACALCAQETETAIAIAAGNKTATATPTNGAVVNATATATKTPTNVAGNSTATITPTSTATSTATATQTSTPAEEEVILKIAGGTPNTTFSIDWGTVEETTDTYTSVYSSVSATCDSSGDWHSSAFYHVVDGHTAISYSGQSPTTISGTCTSEPCLYGTGFTITVETTYLGVVHDRTPEDVPANHSFGPTTGLFY